MKTDNVPGFPGYYISKRGRVFSRVEFAYDTGNRGCRRIYTESWHEIKPHLKKTGKYQISLYKPNDRKVYPFRLHKLVAKLYVPNPNNLPFVCHLDDIGTNNHYKNLQWGTPKENALMREQNHKLRGIKRYKPNGFNSKNCNPMYGSIRIGNASIYSPKDILNWYNNYEEGKSISEICNQFNVPYKTVSRKISLINSDKDKYLTYLNQLVSGNV
jgi:hypothetical protein